MSIRVVNVSSLNMMDDEDLICEEHEEAHCSTYHVPSDLDSALPYLTTRETECMECFQMFPDNRRLYAHMFNIHNYSKSRIEILKKERRALLVKSTASYKARIVHKCFLCKAPYLTKIGVTQHMQREHGHISNSPVNRADNIVCPIEECSIRFLTYIELAVHAGSNHLNLVTNENAFHIHRHRFDSYAKYLTWKTTIEAETSSKFFTRSTETKIKYGRKAWLLKCCFARKIVRTMDDTKTAAKQVHCTAFMRVCERYSGELEVVSCFGHLGHVHPWIDTNNYDIVANEEELSDDMCNDNDLTIGESETRVDEVESETMSHHVNNAEEERFEQVEEIRYPDPGLSKGEKFDPSELIK